MLYGMFLMLLGEYPLANDYQSAFWGLNIGIVGAVFSIIVFFKYIIKTKFYKKMIPINLQKSSEGYSVSSGYEQYIGKIGIAKTDLRPAGIIIISKQEFHCRSKRDFIKKGKKVLIEKVEENELIVS